MASPSERDINTGTSAARAIGRFCGYVKENERQGLDLDQNTLSYMTEHALNAYWTRDAVAEVLNTAYNNPIASNEEEIIKDYIRVWSTLVLVGRPNIFPWFRKNERHDKYFYAAGFSLVALDISRDPWMEPGLKDFGQHWSKFWPIRFALNEIKHERDLAPERVLPFISCSQLGEPSLMSRAKVFEVRLDPMCCGEEYPYLKVVLKLYTDTHPDAAKAFENETEIFGAVYNKGSPIVQYLGSFIQNGKRAVVLEHADGNLRTFFQTHRLPRDKTELEYLWTKLFCLSEAVKRLHNIGSITAGITHRDIKMENILFFKNNDSDDFNFDFKLSDFDTSTPVQRVENRFSYQDNNGSRARCAPEATRTLVITESMMERIPLNSDVWQLGTVFSESLLCIMWDLKSLSIYEEERKKEIEPLKQLVAGGYGICFHDGHKRLDCIRTIHQKALESRKKYDTISEQIAALIENDMLVPHGGRATSDQVFFKFQDMLERVRNGQTLPVGSDQHPVWQQNEENGVIAANQRRPTTNAASNAAQAEKKSSTSRIPLVTTNNVSLWRLNKNKRIRTSTPGGSSGIDQIIDELRGRDQLILIDDAESMWGHLSDIMPVAEAIISLAKKADPDGVEVIFASKPNEVKKKKLWNLKSETLHLVAQIHARFSGNPPHARTNMENKLGTVLDRVAGTKKDTSVYIFTDGVWTDSDEPGGGVERPIKTLISRMKRHDRNRTAITIQFIQFGEDETGTNRLAWLDDELPKSEEGLRDYDIVDTRRHNDNLYLLMIGALSRSVDEIKSLK